MTDIEICSLKKDDIFYLKVGDDSKNTSIHELTITDIDRHSQFIYAIEKKNKHIWGISFFIMKLAASILPPCMLRNNKNR